VAESTLEISIKLEQASKELDSLLAKMQKYEDSISRSKAKWGEQSSQAKATQAWLDKTAASAEKLWTNQQRELNKIEGILRRVGSSIDSQLVKNVDKFGESIEKASKKFDGGISSQFSKLEKEIRKTEKAAKDLEEARAKAEKDPIIGPLNRSSQSATVGQKMGYSSQTGKSSWATPKVEERQYTFGEQIKNLFTQAKGDGKTTSHAIGNLQDVAKIGASASGGGAHYGLISGVFGLVRNLMMAPPGVQMVAGLVSATALAATTAVALAEPVATRSRRSREYGVPYGTWEANEFSMGPYRDAANAMSATRAAQDPTSQQRLAYGTLHLDANNELTKTNNEQIADQTLALKDFIGTFKNFGQFLAFYNNTTALKSMFTIGDVYNVKDTDRSQLQKSAQQSISDQKLFGMDKETQQTYTDLNADLHRFGIALENTTAISLAGFAKAIDGLINWAVGFVAKPQPLIDPKQFNYDAKPPKDAPTFNWGNLVPKFDTGAYNVPDTGMAMLHQDELVMPAKEASAFRNMLSSGTTEGNKDFGEFNKQLMESSNIIIDLNKQMKPLADSMEKANDNFLKGVSGLGPNTVGGGGAAPPSGGPARAAASEAGELSGPGGGGGNIPNSGTGHTRGSGGGGSGPSGTGGGKSVARGTLKANQKEAYQAAIASGLSKDSASALVANMSGEALSKPGDLHWDVSHWARGIVQWDPTRSAAIKAKFGKMPNEMSVGEQTKAALWEMQTNPAYKKTWDALQGGGSVESKIGMLVHNYERPRDEQRAYNERMGYYKGLGNLEGPSEATKTAAQSYGPKTKKQSQVDSASQPSRPTSEGKTPHIGDMSQYQGKDKSQQITIFNKSGSNVNLQTAALGSAQGNFSA
jgi:Phage tail lysozyme